MPWAITSFASVDMYVGLLRARSSVPCGLRDDVWPVAASPRTPQHTKGFPFFPATRTNTILLPIGKLHGPSLHPHFHILSPAASRHKERAHQASLWHIIFFSLFGYKEILRQYPRKLIRHAPRRHGVQHRGNGWLSEVAAIMNSPGRGLV
jgi:hypothetical protein